jgi:hypothetical protein
VVEVVLLLQEQVVQVVAVQAVMEIVQLGMDTMEQQEQVAVVVEVQILVFKEVMVVQELLSSIYHKIIYNKNYNQIKSKQYKTNQNNI